MPIIEKASEIKGKVEQLLPKLRMVFAVDCAEQVFPRYVVWAEDEGRGCGDPKRLKAAIDLIWDVIESDSIPFNLKNEAEIVRTLIPDSEVFPDASGSGALDASCAVFEAIQCTVLHGDIEHAVNASQSALFSADAKLGRRITLRNMTLAQLDKEYEREFKQVKKEWERQLKVVHKLAQWKLSIITRHQFSEL